MNNLEDISKEKFNELVASAVEKYAKKKEMVLDTQDALVVRLQAMWHDMEAEYLAEKDRVEEVV